MPSWLKPLRPNNSDGADVQAFAAQSHPIPLREIMTWDAKFRRVLFRVLLPVDILVQFGIDPITLVDAGGHEITRATRGEQDGSVRLELYHAADARDAMMEVELADTSFGTIEVVWLAFQDPHAPRFDIDAMPDGQTTMRGILRHHVEAEVAALRAGLAPGQIRAGLGAFSRLAGHLESFMSCINQREYLAQPLYYHTAVLFERIGFAYMQGHAQMQQIDRGFAPGGRLRAKLDGSSPFRDPALADTVRGRAWAIHTGILDESWDRVRMIKRLGVDAGVDTSPGVPW